MQRRPLLGLGLACAAAVRAQEPWPSRPIRLVVPFSAGSATNIIARAVGDRLADELGKPLIYDYRAGAGGTLGTAQAARAEADGYTLLAHSSAFTTAPALYARLPYDTRQDLAGVTLLGVLPSVVVVPAASPLRTLGDLVAAARARGGGFNFGTGGIGSGMHMNSEKFNAAAGIRAVHVPFKGSGEVMTELAAGRLDYAVISLTSALAFMKDGRVRALAVPMARRSALAPDLATTAELGVAGAEYVAWIGLLAPARTPRAVLERVQAATARVVALPEVRSRLEQLGAEPQPITPAAFDQQIADEVRVNTALARAAGIPVQ